MKICFLVADISHTGGVERVTSNLAGALKQSVKNIDIEIVSQFKSEPKLWYSFDGCTIHYLNGKDYEAKPHSLKRMFRILGNVIHVRRFFKSHHYDYIVSQSFPNTALLYLAGTCMKNVLAVEHVKYDYYNNLLKSFRLHVYKKTAKVVVLTNNDKECYDRYLPPTQTIQIPNPVVVPEYRQSPLNKKQAVAIGRLQYQKGFDTLTDVYEIVHQKHPEWIVNIYGNGNYRKQIEKHIKAKGLENVVILKGRTDNVPAVMEESAFFILSSRFEGFGMVIAEAMSQGLPVVSFNCPTGPADIVKNDFNGILVENQNVEKMADAICYMIENPEERKRMGKNALSTAKCFGGDIIASQWIQLFDSLRHESR
ncbi:MAG: glycosyltransferase family 4 protein [Bacteroides sp.]|nr:glycosyltransferase family 4 protein [Ruminococcus flavefaciens]MCM1554694.1 glycosyltransferase family 4 protein [Bacteroides sp.]